MGSYMHIMRILGRDQVITGTQIRAARSALGWSGSDLARIAGISLRTVTKIEVQGGLPDARISTIVKLKLCFETAGIEFIGTPEDGPGIRIRPVVSKS